jgi:hypothetical protein
MKRILFSNILILIGLAIGCKKVELEPVDGEPVFEASAIFDNDPLSWQAGVDEYYMFSSNEKDQFNIYSFKGLLAKESNNCCNSLEFVLRDARVTIDGLPDISSAISTEIEYVFAYNSGNDTTFVIEIDTVWKTKFSIVKRFSQPQQDLVHYFEFGDQSFDSTFTDSILHTYQQSPKNQMVTLITKPVNNNNCSSYLTRTLDSLDTVFQNCNLELQFDSIITNTAIQIIANASGVAPFSYVWSDGSNNQIASFSPAGFGPMDFSVTVTDANGCSAQAGISTTLTPGTIPPVCVAGFDYYIQEVYVDSQTIQVDYADSLQFSAATVIYSDGAGNKYRSDRQPQPSDYYFKILEVSDYDENEKGEKTKKITAEFICRVWNESGEHIDIREGRAVIAVSYPD